MTETLGSKLKALRLERKLRQDQVAILVGVNKKQISAYETDSRQPSYDILVSLASLYKVSCDYLLGFNCGITQVIDVSGLTPSEVKMVKEIVDSMVKKNRQLRKLQEMKYGDDLWN